MSIHFEDQINLWEINLAPKEFNTGNKTSPPAVLRRVWWASTKAYNEMQPFSITELKNKPHVSQFDYDNETHIKGDAVLGCDGGILMFYELNAVQNNVAVVGGVAIGSTSEIAREKIKFNSYMRLPSDEPVTHIYELEGANQAGMLLTGQIDGSILIINYATQVIALQVQVVGSNLRNDLGPNCLYYMRPYAEFNLENNPIIVVNDWSDGIYLFNLKSGNSVSLEPKDYKEKQSYFLDYRPNDSDQEQERMPTDYENESSSSESDSDNFYGDSNNLSSSQKVKQIAKARKKFKMIDKMGNEHAEVPHEDLIERL